MKSKKLTVFIAILIVLTCIATIFHFSNREEIPEDALKITYNEKDIYVDIHKLAYEDVYGIRVNGKGEEIQVEGKGILVNDLLEDEKITEFSSATIFADDSYSASVNKEEIEEDNKVYLLYEDESIRLIVFGDTNSKRSVSNVVSIEVK